jgi:hypothetical protein
VKQKANFYGRIPIWTLTKFGIQVEDTGQWIPLTHAFLRGHSTTTWTEVCHFLTPAPALRGQFLYREGRQKQTFFDPSPLILST